jgi:DNA polymerase III delta prime subunit
MSTAIWIIETGRYGEKFEIGSDECWINLETTVESSTMRTTIKSRLKPNQARELADALISAANRTEKLSENPRL